MDDELDESETAKMERDIATNQLHSYCHSCKNYTKNHCEGPCENCKHEYYQYRDENARDNWEWRGLIKMNKIKQKPAYIFFSLLAVMILFYVSIAFGVTLRNSFKAYEMIKHNYGYFNYPNTIQVHSGQYIEDTEYQFFVGKISAENAYGQRNYDGYFASEELFASFESIEEIGMDVPDYIREESQKKNVFVPVVNFLIGMDW